MASEPEAFESRTALPRAERGPRNRGSLCAELRERHLFATRRLRGFMFSVTMERGGPSLLWFHGRDGALPLALRGPESVLHAHRHAETKGRDRCIPPIHCSETSKTKKECSVYFAAVGGGVIIMWPKTKFKDKTWLPHHVCWIWTALPNLIGLNVNVNCKC